MANPQAEAGHTDIANELVEAFAGLQLSGYQWRILWVVIRQTYGWHKRSDRISITKFEEKTGLKRRHAHLALSELIKMEIVTKIGNGQNLEYSLQKDWEKWTPLPISVTAKNRYRNRDEPLPKSVTKPLPKSVKTKEKKETIKRKEPEERNFAMGLMKLSAILKAL